MNADNIANLLLQPIDTLGFYLGRYGITNAVNRHNLIALAVTEKEHWTGELEILEMRARIRKRKLTLASHKLEKEISTWINRNAPKPVANRFNKLLSSLHAA